MIFGRLKLGHAYSQSVPNALMISKPRAPFWLQAMRSLVRRVNCADPMFDTVTRFGPSTRDLDLFSQSSRYSSPLPHQSFWLEPHCEKGPTMLTALTVAHGSTSAVRILNQSYFYSISWNADGWVKVDKSERVNVAAMAQRIASHTSLTTYAVTPWMHSWEARAGRAL